jgi:alginate O-acetyltransferase complex protein AlgI
MQFNSYSYVLLLIPAAGLFWGLPAAWRRWYVLALSLAYYATWKLAFLAVPLVLCTGVHLLVRGMIRQPRSARMRFWSGIGFVLTIFLFFRYRDFLLGNFNSLLALLRVAPVTTALRLAVPLGISFYSFEAISYLIDAKQGRIKASRFPDLYLFVMFWPHLMAGPIVRFRELAPQFGFSKPFELPMLIRGLDRLILGLVQKNVLANPLGAWVDDGFLPNAIRTNTTIDSWALAVAFGLQIYFDFAAYSNMAIGAAQMIGVTLPENFRFPYHAWNPSDFWNRWHMTLSRWIRDYLFFPVNARFRGAPAPLYFSLLGIMALVGLWHGPGWGFVLWGMLHGVYLVLYRIWENARGEGRPPVAASSLSGWLWRGFTLAAVTAAWVPFRASTGALAVHMLASMFGRFRFGLSYGPNFYLVTLLGVLICALEPALTRLWERLERFSGVEAGHFTAYTGIVRPLVYALGLLLFLAFDERNMQFIYFQF